MNSYHESSAWSLAVSFVQIHFRGGRLMYSAVVGTR